MLSMIQCSCYDFSKSDSNLLGTRNGIERNPLIPSVSELIYVVFRLSLLRAIVSTAGDHHPGLFRNTSGIYGLREMFPIKEQHTSESVAWRVGESEIWVLHVQKNPNNSSDSNKSVRSTVQEPGPRLSSHHPRA